MEVFFLVGSVQALFFCVLIFSKQERSDADKILGNWLLVLGVQLIVPFIVYRNPDKYFYLGGIDAWLFPASAIFMFVYTKTLTAVNNKLNRKLLYNFLVLILINIAFIPFYKLSADEKLKIIHKEEFVGIEIILGAILNWLVFIAYVITTLITIQKHKKRIYFEFSYEQNIDLKWLQNLIFSLISIGIIFIGLIAVLATHEIHIYDADYYFYLLQVLFILGIGYWGFKQGRIFPYKEKITSSEIGKESKKLNTSSAKEYLVKELHEYMTVEKPFLNPTLSLYDLASSLRWSTHELSVLLNQSMHTNFYEFVNNYRVEEVKKRLKQNNQKFTVLAIAFDCGFNSKASFNRIFKQKTGYTPSDFLRHN